MESNNGHYGSRSSCIPDSLTHKAQLVGRWGLALLVAFALSFAVSAAAPSSVDAAFANESGAISLQPASLSADDAKTLETTAKFSPKISKKKLSLVYGKSSTLKVTANKGKKVKWSTSNKKVATVKSTGTAKAKVSAKGAGKATITAKVGGKKLSCVVTVKGKISATKINTTIFDSGTLKLVGAKAKSWKSSNTDFATVNKKGVVTGGERKGTATITCTDTKGNKYSCKVINTFPSVSCEMDKQLSRTLGGETFYFKHCILRNSCGHTVTLANKYMMYWPYSNDSETSSVLIGLDSMDNAESFDEYPIDVPSGYRLQFVGLESTHYPLYYDRMFAMTLTVEGVDYSCVFSTEGSLLSIGAQS